MPGEQQAERRELTAAGCGAHHDEQNQAGAGERPDPDADDAGHHVPVERDRDHGAERRAGRHAQRVGRGQRVAEHRLEQAAGERQRAAREQAEQRPRQPQLREDRPVRLLPRQTRPQSSALGPTNGSNSAAAAKSSAEPPSHATTGRRLIGITGTTPRAASRRCSTVSRAENARSHAGSSSAVSAGRSRATPRSASTIRRVQNVRARFTSCVTATHAVPRSASSRST